MPQAFWWWRWLLFRLPDCSFARSPSVSSPARMFLIGFAALFSWQIGGFIRRNRPQAYTFDDLPKELLP